MAANYKESCCVFAFDDITYMAADENIKKETNINTKYYCGCVVALSLNENEINHFIDFLLLFILRIVIVILCDK